MISSEVKKWSSGMRMWVPYSSRALSSSKVLTVEISDNEYNSSASMPSSVRSGSMILSIRMSSGDRTSSSLEYVASLPS